MTIYKKAILLSISLFSIANSVSAVCPVCVVAVGAGLGLSRWLGVDDVIASMWIGGLLAALSIWTVVWLKKKNWSFKYSKIVIPATYYILTLVPLYYIDIIGHPLNTIFGIDKIVFGAVVGTIIFLLAVWLHEFLKMKNGNKSFFPYQKVALPLVILLITSLIFYLLITQKWI